MNQKLVVEAKGEVAALAETINNMTDTLSIFADQVTTVAREVGTEGKLGGQAKVPNVAGTWKDLTDNVNFMANSLTVQVRAISDVATAVTEGDLTRSITVEAQGEVYALKNNINQMIANLQGHHPAEQGARLAQNQPRPFLGHDAGPENPGIGGSPDHVGADAAGIGASRRVLHQRRRWQRPNRC